jgi:hypothetical protein
MINHMALRDLGNGALATLRILTCLDEQDRPEIVAAMLRMAVGRNRTVDNLHAGGIAAQVALTSGILTEATDLGLRVHRGFVGSHPDSGAPIAGRVIPHWPTVCALARRAHLAFADRIFIGWDIAVLDDGPCVVEANSGPDVDLLQRHDGRGLCATRYGVLLAWHVRQCTRNASAAADMHPAPPSDQRAA